MNREKIESILSDIHCKGFAFELKSVVPEIKSTTMKMMAELDVETRDSIYEILYPEKCFYTLKVIALGQDSGNDGPAVKFDKVWLITPAMKKSDIIETVFDAVLNASEVMVKREFKFMGNAIFNSRGWDNAPLFVANIPRAGGLSESIKKMIKKFNGFRVNNIPIIPNEEMEILFAGEETNETPPDMERERCFRFVDFDDMPWLVMEDGILVQKKEVSNG